MTAEHDELFEAIRRHLPEPAVRHIDRAAPIAGRSAAGNAMFVVESYDREHQPLESSIGSDGDSVMIGVRYLDGRHHKERWIDGRGEIVDGRQYEPQLWAGRFA